MLNTEQWYDDNGITLRKGETIAMIDRRTCEVVTEEGDRVPYDRLLIATGSNPIMLPLPGKDLPRVAMSSMSLAGAVILILAMANALINFVVQEQIPGKILEQMVQQSRVGTELWFPLAILVLAIAASETFLAQWFGRPR